MTDPEFIAEVRLEDSDLALGETIRSHPDFSIELDYQIVSDTGDYYVFFEVSGSDFDAFEGSIEADPTVANSAVVSTGTESRIYRMQLLATEYLVLSKAAELGLRVMGARAMNGGWETTLEVPEATMIQRFRAECVENGISFETKRLYRTDDDASEFGLTPNQRDVLVTAHRAGYFNEPRDASLQDLADSLGISSSAVSGRLRRAIDALIVNTVEGD